MAAIDTAPDVDFEYYLMLDRVLYAPSSVTKSEDARTDVGYKSYFGSMSKYDLTHGFPVLSLKRTNWRAAFTEMFWFMSGSVSVDFLHKHGVHIWDEWASSTNSIGPMYGAQWREWLNWDNGTSVDQLQQSLNTLRSNPDSRRNVVTAWNVSDLPEMALAPCHGTFQWHYDRETNSLDLAMFQRSADLFLGVPFNVANYALLQTMFARMIGANARTFTHFIGDMHLYDNHLDQGEEVYDRAACGEVPANSTPTLEMDEDLFKNLPKGGEIDELVHRFNGVDEHFDMCNYNPLPAVKGEVAV